MLKYPTKQIACISMTQATVKIWKLLYSGPAEMWVVDYSVIVLKPNSCNPNINAKPSGVVLTELG